MATATKYPPVQEAGNTSVRVEIFDQAYNLRGTDPEYILKLAEYVDGKMRAVADQTHTVDSSRLAIWKAQNAGLSLAGSAVASDALFPFADGVEAAAAAGATAVIQPGGSLRDDEVIAAADRLGMAMVFTGRRHFRH